MICEVILIRHGETPANERHQYLGWTEESLTQRGKETLLKRKDILALQNVEQVFCSPMRRCRESADILYPDMTPVSIHAWKEICFGVFEGKTYQQLQDLPAYQAWIDSQGMMQIPEGESRAQFIVRVCEGFTLVKQHILLVDERDRLYGVEQARMKDYDRKIACVVHGGTIMALLSTWSQRPYFDFQVRNGQGYVCRLMLTEKETRMLAYQKIE